MTKLVAARKPKFRKLHGVYPLTRFRAYLLTKLSPSRVPSYLAAIRRMLGHLGEGTVTEAGKMVGTWHDTRAVQAYFETLMRPQQDVLQAVFTHWLRFLDEPMERSLSPRVALGSLATALNTLLDMQGKGQGVLAFEITSIPHMRWWLGREGEWGIVRTDTRSDSVTPLPPYLEPLGETIRQWAGAAHGSPFVPDAPFSAVPMPLDELRKILNRHAPASVVEQLQTRLDDAAEAARALAPAAAPAGGSTRTSRAGTGFHVRAEKGKDAEIVFEKDPEYENYVPPADPK